jgi:phosphoenolpyruvate carboxylase
VLLARWTGCADVRITPLFETLDDLTCAAHFWRTIFAGRVSRALARCGGKW